MRVPVAWLRSYCDPGLPAAEIAERLTSAGLELDRIHRTGVGDPKGFVVGRVLEAERHPDADRLTVCRVDDGSGEPRTIVCGAPNVAAGQTVAVARPGAAMPDGSVLGEAKLRGVRSSGMILAEDEVGVGEDHTGIMVLDGGAAPGDPLAGRLQIMDEVLELEVNPNRPDALGVYGVARDLHALTAAPLAADPTGEDGEALGDDRAEQHASVEVADPEICLRFTARVFEDVRIGPSPAWLKQRLTAAGQRPISNVVDITNYVMLAYGQPLHAFDLDAVRGSRIVVRRAREGERMTTLDGVERSFSSEAALVCDAEGPSGIAGIMGGQVSEVSDRTTRVLMEAATWAGPNILRTSKALGLRTEASARFEKQLHPETAAAAQRLAARLMVELCGARLVPGTIDAYPRPHGRRVVRLRHGRIGRLLGKEVPRAEVEEILVRLGFESEGPEAPGEDERRWCVPVWRDSDVQREADLIEEVARVHGLNRLPATLPARRHAVGRLTRHQRLRRRLEDSLRDRGLMEAVTYSYTAPATMARLRLADSPRLEVDNPLSEEQRVMRPLILPGLLDVAQRNASHGRRDVALFESAHVYLPRRNGAPAERARSGRGSTTTAALEPHHIGALLVGTTPGSWRTQPRRVDLYAARAVLEGLLASAVVEWHAAPSSDRPFLHPGRAATISCGERELGWLGEIHPAVAAEWDLEAAAAFEVDVDVLAEQASRDGGTYRDLTAFPAVLQDIAVVVGEEVPAAAVERAVAAGAGELLSSAHVFDLYRGEQLGEGRKSLALRLEFRAPDRTLTDADVAGLRADIEARLEEIGGRLRA